jgi:predicted SAM-dependent methyltransferase
MADPVKTLLHIGCGFQGVEALPPLDWAEKWRQVRVDIDPDVEPDIVASMTHMPMVESDSVDIVFSKHNLEHLESHEVPLALGEFHRVLKPTGFLICRCPDLGAAIDLLATKDLEETLWVSTYDDGAKVEVALIDMIFGARAEIARGKGFMRHRTGFTGVSLTRHLKRAGFEGVSVSRNTAQMELLCNARKVELGNLFTNLNAELNTAARRRS